MGINLIWAITLLLIVTMVGGAIYYSGALNAVQEKEVDVKIETPALPKAK